MKKILLLTFALVLSANIFAQRSVSFTVDQINKPTEINSNAQGLSTFDINVVMKVNGPDSLMAGDSILISWYVLAGQTAFLFPGPTPTNIAIYKVLTKTYKTDDTIQFNSSAALNVFVVNSGNVTFGFRAFAWNRPDLTQTNLANNGNLKTQSVTWYNQYKNGVSVENVSNSMSVSIYPSPAINTISISLPVLNTENINTTITDLTGKTVLAQNFAATDALSMDVSSLSNGVYILNVKNGDLTHQTKITIAK